MIRAILIIGVIALAVGVIIYSLIDCARSDARDIRGLRRGPWLAIILLLPVIGGILWLTLGRPRYASPGSVPTRGKGPDDDPEFLRQLDRQRRQAERERQRREQPGEEQAGPDQSSTSADDHQDPDDDAPRAPEDGPSPR
ncbi:putative membrane protein [Kocuria palustris PEL]|uniref:Membrane protein n=1 Tax=Kocuria palustris PEL TaxID=1236550 RepID=M2XWR3_9MICC|nr:PLD nuclease N-terminal domain-containing protein [Kocuria palustris]EME37258.1 putative membrane protein [Kocuria palustris PEL]